MWWINESEIMIVGLGLMGGSYAKGLKRLGFHVSAIDQREESIRYALEKGLSMKASPVPIPKPLPGRMR